MYVMILGAMDVPLTLAGSLALVAALVHGVGGELLVVRKLAVEKLPRTRFGGQRMTMAMIHVTWHVTTLAFLAIGVALLLSGLTLDGEGAEALALLGAGAFTGFAAIAIGLGAGWTSPGSLRHHPGPVALAAVAALAWWGAV